MRCTKLELTVLLGVGIFLIGTTCLIVITVQKVFPAREEQDLKAINCTITSGNMIAKAKCQHKTQDDSSYPCLRVYVVCGKDAKKPLKNAQPRLLLKDFHSLKKQVRADVFRALFLLSFVYTKFLCTLLIAKDLLHKALASLKEVLLLYFPNL